MSDERYNGWANYATWRVNLEVFDGFDPQEVFYRRPSLKTLGYFLKEYAKEAILNVSTGPAVDYAEAFLSDVNYYEIANNMRNDYWLDETDWEDTPFIIEE